MLEDRGGRVSRRPDNFELALNDPIADMRRPALVALSNQIGECRLVDDVGDRLSDLGPERIKMAAAGKFANLGPGLADAIHRRNRPVDVSHDLADGQVLGGPRQAISPSAPRRLCTKPPPFS